MLMPVDVNHIHHDHVSDTDVRQYRQNLRAMTLEELNKELEDNTQKCREFEGTPGVVSSYFLFARLAREERDARVKGMFR
jgi:hypothetical protein